MSDLDWPTAFDRTAPGQRTTTRRFEADIRGTIEDLETTLDRLGVDDWRLATAMDHRSDKPNVPYANAPQPDDPGVVVRWRMDGEQFAVACDAYTSVRDNLRELYLYVEEKRKMDGRAVVTGESEFANARLPPGDEDAETIVAGSGRDPPHEVLGVAPDAPDDVIKAAARRLSANVHPDKEDGDEEAFKRIQQAKDELLAEGSA